MALQALLLQHVRSIHSSRLLVLLLWILVLLHAMRCAREGHVRSAMRWQVEMGQAELTPAAAPCME